MHLIGKSKLGARFLANHLLQEVDVRTDGHMSKPNVVYAHLTPTCNLKCIHCNLPRPDGIAHGTLRRVDEMSTDEWRESLTYLREWLGPFKLNISGGEPFVRKDIRELLRFACDLGIMTGVVTNGTFINEALAEELVAAGRTEDARQFAGLAAADTGGDPYFARLVESLALSRGS